MLDKILYAKLWLQAKADDLLHDDEGAVDIVAIVVLIGIVVVLAILFRKQLVELLERLFKAIGITADEAVKDINTTPSTTPGN